MQLNSLLSRRWSPYAFNPGRLVEPEKLALCLEAARWAPSSYNEQPWHIVYADKFSNPEAHARLLSYMVDFNSGWAQHAPVVGLISRRLKSQFQNTPNSHAEYDCGAAMAMLAVQATDLGLHLHQMSGFNPVKADTETKLPEGFSSMTMFALGYLADDVSFLPELYRERNEKQRIRVRKDQGQVSSPAEFK